VAKRKSARSAGSRSSARKPSKARRSVKRQTARKTAARPAPGRARQSATSAGRAAGSAPRKASKVAKRKVARKPKPSAARAIAAKRPHLDRERRRLDETAQTPPSSLDMDRRGSAARSGRAALNASLREHTGMTPELTGGDVDADWENAYFSGEEAPGGDNPTPDDNVVDDMGKALGVEYQDNEDLRASDKVVERDRHRWELDPASSEDYKDRK